MIAFQVDHAHGKNIEKGEFIFLETSQLRLSVSGLPCWVTSNSKGHQSGKVKSFPALGSFKKKGSLDILKTNLEIQIHRFSLC